MQKPSVIRTRGFTLVEMSIVLIVISLIVAGIITGKDLVHSAELKSVITDINKIKIALNLYEDKYDAMPGDHAIATQYWPGLTNDGGGDRKIDWGVESHLVWQHFNLSKFINVDTSSASGSIHYANATSLKGAHFIIRHESVYGKSSNYIGLVKEVGGAPRTVISSQDAVAIDKKIDDGIAGSGWVYGSSAYGGCVIMSTPPTYALNDVGERCSMWFWLD